MALCILGTGTAFPPHRISQKEAARAASVLADCNSDQAEAVSMLYQQTDIEGRHMIFGRDVIGDVLHGTRDSKSAFVPRDKNDLGPDTAERMRTYEREALPLALEASLGALADAKMDMKQI